MVASINAEVPSQSCGSPLKKWSIMHAKEPISVNDFKKNFLLQL